jgi:hypothetical protein
MFRPSSIGKLLANVLAVGILIWVLVFLRSNPVVRNSSLAVYRQDRDLTNFLVDRLATLQSAGLASAQAAQSEAIELIGPPSGAQFEETEPVRVHWKSTRPLKAGEVFVIALAYYVTDAGDLTPHFAQFTSRESSYELPPLVVGTNKIPVFAWAVYMGDSQLAAQGPVSTTHLLYRAPRANVGKVLRATYGGWDNWW